MKFRVAISPLGSLSPPLPTPLCFDWARRAGAEHVSRGMGRLTYQSLAQIQPFGLGGIELGIAVQLLWEQTELTF